VYSISSRSSLFLNQHLERADKPPPPPPPRPGRGARAAFSSRTGSNLIRRMFCYPRGVLREGMESFLRPGGAIQFKADLIVREAFDQWFLAARLFVQHF